MNMTYLLLIMVCGAEPKNLVQDLQIKYQKPITNVLAFLTISLVPKHHNTLMPTNMLVSARYQVPGNVRDYPRASVL